MLRQAEAISENQKALALDPLSLPINNFMGVTYMFAGDYGKAYQQFQHTIAMAPTFPLAHAYFARLLKAMGRYQESIQEHEKAEILSGASAEAASAEAAAVLKAFKAEGERGFYKKLLELDLQTAKRSPPYVVSPGDLAADYALLAKRIKLSNGWIGPTRSGRGIRLHWSNAIPDSRTCTAILDSRFSCDGWVCLNPE